MRNFLGIVLIILFVTLLATGCGGTAPTIGPATLTVYNNSSSSLDAAYFNGTDFTSIAVGASQKQSITSGACFLYVVIASLWYKCNAALTVNAGDNATFTFDNNTQLLAVTGPGASLTGGQAQPLKDILGSR